MDTKDTAHLDRLKMAMAYLVIIGFICIITLAYYLYAVVLLNVAEHLLGVSASTLSSP
jgi:hypothetical protein